MVGLNPAKFPSRILNLIVRISRLEELGRRSGDVDDLQLYLLTVQVGFSAVDGVPL